MVRRAAVQIMIAFATMAAVIGVSAAPVRADQAIVCDYRLDVWSGGFVADVTIRNNGSVINGWTATWRFSRATQIYTTWGDAVVTVANQYDATARNLPAKPVIPTGGRVDFGFIAFAEWSDGPSPITVNGVRCR
jgi:Cellulose binding domain